MVGAAKRLETAFYAAVATQLVTDPVVARHVREIAVDKAEHMDLLEVRYRASALRPDISPPPFSVVARAAGLGATFDPFTGDRAVLVGAFIIEQSCAAAYRCLRAVGGPEAGQLGLLIADAGYHAGLMGADLEARGEAEAAKRIAALFGELTAVGTAGEGDARNAANGLLLGYGARGRGGFFPEGLIASSRRTVA